LDVCGLSARLSFCRSRLQRESYYKTVVTLQA
jgi:hypothetical protein